MAKLVLAACRSNFVDCRQHIGVTDLTDETHAVREVVRANEKGIDARHRRNLVNAGNSIAMFDLNNHRCLERWLTQRYSAEPQSIPMGPSKPDTSLAYAADTSPGQQFCARMPPS